MHRAALADGTLVPALGLGTWRLGEHKRARSAEIDAVRTALALGYRLIDTAEMYGDGGAEEVIGAALAQWFADGGRRDELFVVSKVYPHNAGRRGAIAACERSLRRLGLDRLDLYLLHWRGAVPLAETVQAFEQLRAEGRIARWGVSNFDLPDLQSLWSLPHGARCASDQVWYSPSQRGVEFDLLPALQARGVPLMAYSPLDQGALAHDPTFAAIGRRHGVSASQAALAWVLSRRGVIAIPMSTRAAHLRENLAAATVTLDADDFARIDRAFPPPAGKRPLAMC